ncbi:MAG: tetratricopeptide repeat protein [Bacteroidetes bacterium]|nr:tetratricopeptide repeat protein [Bacteroidota bacterium]
MTYSHNATRPVLWALLFLLFPFMAFSQVPDSLSRRLDAARPSAARVDALNAIAWELRHNEPELALDYAAQAQHLADSLAYEEGQGWAYRNTGVIEYILGNYAEAITANLNGLRIFERLENPEGIASSYNNIGVVHWQLGNLDKAQQYFKDALEASATPERAATTNANLGLICSERGDYAGALRYTRLAYEQYSGLGDLLGASTSLNNIGWIYELQKQYDNALREYRRSLEIREKLGDKRRIASVCLSIGSIMRQTRRFEEALESFSRALSLSQGIGDRKQVEEAFEGLSRTYADMRNFEQAYHHHLKSAEVKDSLLDESKARELAKVEASYKLEQAEREVELLKRTNELQSTIAWATAGVLLLVIVFSVISFFGYRSKSRIAKKLQATQKQLIVQGKLASLGQLTAGIAHEIRNPLNFIKNFSEVSKELLEELEQEKDDPEKFHQVYKELMQAVEKIHEHGNRADAIVSGMMLHARSSSEERQSADVNALLGYVLELAAHGTKAMHCSMKPEFATELDPALPAINVVPQDLSQVFLNIINNAIDAVSERCQKNPDDEFAPRISVSTRLSNRSVTIRIRDNGGGIPESVRTRIFEPFYTTKETGKGTGLGLSITYDIIVQKYEGSLDVLSEENEYTEFVITLPVG